VIGEHQGLMYHTLGQRKGLGIGGLQNAGEAPWYVVGKDMAQNRLLVAQGADHPALFSYGLKATKCDWVDRTVKTERFKCTVKTRYRQADIPCTVTPLNDDTLEVIFDSPQAAVTPGQSAVFYLDEVCLGGAIIEQHLQKESQ
jgi:tRNA-specific 2-thiouridylase